MQTIVSHHAHIFLQPTDIEHRVAAIPVVVAAEPICDVVWLEERADSEVFASDLGYVDRFLRADGVGCREAQEQSGYNRLHARYNRSYACHDPCSQVENEAHRGTVRAVQDCQQSAR